MKKRIICFPGLLFTDAEFFLGDNSTITVDVFADQIVKERTALAYKHLESAGCGIVLVVALEVLSEVLDKIGRASCRERV